ncbi:beta-N-acetylhexosaminidase [Streptomyces sp. NPDC097619]|uniref:beta-N-acetylhexosaminidase n=1 Tax=Streptomyces sp. NPDC097619 TaxID=3157228 RepID=UPI00333285D0
MLPRPLRSIPLPGSFTLTEDTALRPGPGTAPVAGLLRTLLAPATGLPLPDSPDGAVLLVLDPAEHDALGPEGYRLTVLPDRVRLLAAEPAGLRHAVQSLRQLLPAEALGDRPAPGTAWTLPGVDLLDRPRHAWRGLMVDTARHFQPLDRLLRTVDRIALHKLNVLHLHLTDDQGWRLPVDAYPRLTTVGAVRDRTRLGPAEDGTWDERPHGGAYTKAELRLLVRHAAERGVTVLPEIEMPGHVGAALAAYPHLGVGSARPDGVWTDWGVSERVLGTHEPVLDFFRTVLDETMELFPSPYVHLGGDECPTVQWEEDPDSRSRAAALGLPSARRLRTWFLGRMGEHLLAAGRRPICWAEEEAGTLPTEFTLMAWRDAGHGLTAARRGHPVVMAPHRTTYLDYPQTDRHGEPPGQAGAVVDLPAVWSTDPAPADWPAEEAGRVLGTQAQLWTEYVTTGGHYDRLLWPRLCALADRAWNPTGEYRRDFLPALAAHRPRLAALGVTTPGPGA